MKKLLAKVIAVAMAASIGCVLASCDVSTSSEYSEGDDYDYHDAAGNGYNDDDVDWDNDGDGGIGWDKAVNDWDREHGIY